MILSGVDIVKNERMTKMLTRSRANLTAIFSRLELDYCLSKRNPAQSLGVRFAAKEAVLKAADAGILEYDLTQIEVYNSKTGKPYLNIYSDQLTGKIKKLLNKDSFQTSLSLSHEKEYSIAQVIIF